MLKTIIKNHDLVYMRFSNNLVYILKVKDEDIDTDEIENSIMAIATMVFTNEPTLSQDPDYTTVFSFNENTPKEYLNCGNITLEDFKKQYPEKLNVKKCEMTPSKVNYVSSDFD